jgi:hypothetical protein
MVEGKKLLLDAIEARYVDPRRYGRARHLPETLEQANRRVSAPDTDQAPPQLSKPTYVASYVPQNTAKPPLVAGEGWLGTLASCRGS